MCVALGDGRLVRSGGRVVKNVAGYDSHKLHIGALGTLGVIAEVTFKVQPLPERRRTLLASFTSGYQPEQAIAGLRAAPLEPIAVVALNYAAELATPALHAFLEGQPRHIVIAAHFAGTAAAVERQIREAARRCFEAGARTIELSEEDDAPLWAAIADFTAPSGDGSLLLRAAAPGGEITPVARLAERVALRREWQPAQLALAGSGLVYSRWQVAQAGPSEVAAALSELRAGMSAMGGYAVIEEAPAPPTLDIWGPTPEGAAIMRSLRASWDPAGMLNPGRYLI
jgi:glycolate oxidase FAD binding subunit